MRINNRTKALAALLLATAFGHSLQAEVKMPALFSDNMVMQQQIVANLWGTASPNKTVTVTPTWDGKSYTTQADAKGAWKMTLPTPKAGGPYDVVISDGTPLTLHNVMIGELWLCSGQSNMEMPMKGFTNQPVEGSNMDALRGRNERIRFFTMKRNSVTVPATDCVGSWVEATPATIREFSATAYYFGRQLEETLQVPVGLVVAAWGGSSCEAWMNEEMLKAFPEAIAKIPQTNGKITSKNQTPTVLFNGMLSPLIGMTMRGVIWYQGESNWERAHTYADLFASLITGWRRLWGQGDFPFYYCQIAPYSYKNITGKGKPLSNSAYLREAQAKVEFMVPKTGMAVLMDAGFKNGIHPYDKRTPGERLALLALNKTYGIEGITSESPYYKSCEIRNDTVIVSFERAPMWVNVKHGFSSKNFKVAGEDRVFYPAKAEIKRQHVIVTSDKVAHPVAVRYAFEDYAEGDLYGAEGLPVSSFRSDDWEDPKPLNK